MFHISRIREIAVAFIAIGFALPSARAADVSFRNDVMAVLSKAGCNAGTCHGNQNGKGGFKLSLRGENPDQDFATLTRDQSARRINLLEPAQSLLLLKPAMQVPHEGGQRFAVGSPEFEILRRWIAASMPPDASSAPKLVALNVTPAEQFLLEPRRTVQLHADAVYSDGTHRDVTRLAIYDAAERITTISADGLIEGQAFGETTVIVRYLNRQAPVRLAFVPERPGFVFQSPPAANFIDEQVFAKLRTLRVNPSPVCDDIVFIRRAYLDLLGIVPASDEAHAFIADRDPQKRQKLIDLLLGRTEFADYWAMKWSDLLRNEEKTLDQKGVQDFHAWIRSSIAHGKPLNQFARELIAARGSTYTNPEANFYRAMRDPLMRAESTAQLFLGVRLQCAKCHNHPFDQWTQDDYYGWANLFARVKYKVLENRRLDANDKHEFAGEQIVYMAGEDEVTNPRTGSPTSPRLLGDTASIEANDDRLLKLADWVAGANNERFATTQANRIWFQLMGRGIVDPIDDFRLTNPATNPRLLASLRDELIAHKFDLRHMIRLIMNSQTYQLASTPNSTNADDETNFSRAGVRRLEAEQLLDSLSRVADMPIAFNGYPVGMPPPKFRAHRAVGLRGIRLGPEDQFLKLFGKPERLQSCECERSNETTLSQAFQLIGGEFMNRLIGDDSGRIARLAQSQQKTGDIIGELYWSALSRAPSADELQSATALADRSANRRSALEDVLWALVTSNEFLLRR